MLISSKFKKDSETPERIKQNKSFDYSMIFIHTIPVTSAGHLVKCSINIHYWYYIYIYVQFTTNRTFYIRVCVLIYITFRLVQFSSVQSLSCVRLSVTPWITACQASLSNTNSGSSLRLTSIESVMPSRHLILCRPLVLLPSIFPSIRVFSSESALRIRWPKYWSFSFTSVLPVNTQDWSPLGWTGWTSLQSKGLSRVFSNTTVQKHQFFGAQPSSQSNSHIYTWTQEKP